MPFGEQIKLFLLLFVEYDCIWGVDGDDERQESPAHGEIRKEPDID